MTDRKDAIQELEQAKRRFFTKGPAFSKYHLFQHMVHALPSTGRRGMTAAQIRAVAAMLSTLHELLEAQGDD